MKKRKSSKLPDAESLLAALRAAGRPLRLEAIAAMLNLGAVGKKSLEKFLRNLADSGAIACLAGGFYSLPGVFFNAARNGRVVSGQYLAMRNGLGRVVISDPPGLRGRELFISSFHRHGAWHRDTVRAVPRPGAPGKGSVVEIVKRAQERVPAILREKRRRTLEFIAADGRLDSIFIIRKPQKADLDRQIGQLALLKPIEHMDQNVWEAQILEWLGEADLIAAQEEIVKLSQDVPTSFPPLALEQAKALPPAPAPADLAARGDLCHIPFVTIDGDDARDFDDAIAVEKSESGYILRVAIADVSHYVQPDERAGSLDQEARARGNSWYFPRSVEPMLPRELSNGLCSLRPREDRLAMLVEMPFSKTGAPGKPRFAPIAMRSRARITYRQAAAFLAGDDSAIAEADLQTMLRDASELYEILAKIRRERGSLDFEMPEPAYEFDADGRLVAMREARISAANRMIEEFMIAANEAVAEFLQDGAVPILYRCHPAPEAEKLAKLQETLELAAMEILPPDLRKGALAPADLQRIIRAAHGTPQEYVVNRLCLRSMGQARYQPENIGHFGLASPAYCHFTSPIRRYADLLVHRALKAFLDGRAAALPDATELAQTGDELNALERRAVECEREMTRRMACLAMHGREGEVFAGAISGVTDFGVFVELDALPVEGLIRMEELGNDWFELDQKRQRLLGAKSQRVWQLGQPVKVALMSVDLEKQEIRLKPAKAAPKLPRSRHSSKTSGKSRK